MTDKRIKTIPATKRGVRDSPNTSTPMVTAVRGSKAPMMAVGVAPASRIAMVMNTSERTVGTSPNQPAKNHALGDGGNWRGNSDEVKE